MQPLALVVPLAFIAIIIPCIKTEIPPGCQGNIDLTFIIDQSESIRENDPLDEPDKNWNLFKSFVKGLIQNLPVGTETNVALIKYSTYAEVQWNLDAYSYTLDVERQVDSLQCEGGNTNTAEALQMAREQVYRADRGDRPGSKDIILLMTDGLSNIRGSMDLLHQAQTLNNGGVEIYVVAIGKYVDEEELRNITKDFSKNIIRVRDFFRLSEVKRILAYRVCGLPDPPPIPSRPEDCNNIMDLTFIVDNSGSIADKNKQGEIDNYTQLKNFLVSLIDQIDIGTTRTRIAVIRFSDVVHTEFRLGEYNDIDDLKRKILKMPFRGLDTNTSGAIRTAANQVYSGSPGDRFDVQDVIILVTDGESTIEQNKTIQEAVQARRKGIQIFVVGVTDEIEVDELMQIASDPVDEHFFDLTGVEYLSSISYNLIKNVCRRS